MVFSSIQVYVAQIALIPRDTIIFGTSHETIMSFLGGLDSPGVFEAFITLTTSDVRFQFLLSLLRVLDELFETLIRVADKCKEDESFFCMPVAMSTRMSAKWTTRKLG